MVGAVYYVFVLIFMFSDSELSSAAGDEGDNCPPFFECGNLGNLSYPYTTTQYKRCGIFPIHGCDDYNPNATKTVQLINGRKQFQVRGVEQEPLHFSISVKDEQLENLLVKSSCEVFCYDIDLPPTSALGYYQVQNNITLYKCNRTLTDFPSNQFLNYTGCVNKTGEIIYYGTQNIPDNSPFPLAACSRVQLPVNGRVFSSNPFTFIAAEFNIEFQYSDECHQCYSERSGECGLDRNGEFLCRKSQGTEDKGRPVWKLIIVLVAGLAGVFITIFLVKRRYNISCFQRHSGNIYFDAYSNTNPERLTLDLGVPVFSFEELEEATNKFDPLRELGSGGFGIVYYGKLKDEREVAVKRLYEHKHDNKRVKQFKNEIQILTCLRHRNLVSLYGYTSHRTRELMLVYEYIPNGTLASHLHGDLANPKPNNNISLSWPVRMKIAIETASALTYLHASGIIHRDIKTNNILLDNHFCVKVADFGISRLFPNDASHVTTAPQGTLGYVDPEYQESHKLTDKSDVYSFGVVLVELISSMKAVDETRKNGGGEIKLANLAIKKIQRGAIGEMVDPSLGFELNDEFRRMIVSVAELAFWCLKRDKRVRPCMHGVLKALQKIESGNDVPENLVVLPTSLDPNEVGSLKNLKPRPLHQTK